MKTDHICELTAEMKQEVKKIVERDRGKKRFSAIAATIGAMMALLGALHLVRCKNTKVIFLLCKDEAAEALEGDAHAE